jgi:hypothetical protein
LPETKTDEVAIDLFHVGQFTIGAKGVVMVPTAGGAALTDGVKKLSGKFGIELIAAVALLATLCASFFLMRPRGRALLERLGDSARRVGPVIAEQVVSAMQAGERVEAFATTRAAPTGALGLVARHLAVAQSELSTLEVAEMLRWHGYEFSDNRSHRTETRAWLESKPCFREVARGRWVLGFHVEGLSAGYLPAVRDVNPRWPRD